MADATPEFPWSDLVESEDGNRLTAPKTGRYVLRRGDTVTEIQAAEVQWVISPTECTQTIKTDEPPC